MRAVADPRAIFFGVIVDQALTLLVPRLVPASDLAVLAAIGAACTMLGGYLAGRLASGGEVLQGAAVGGIALAIGLLSEIGPAAELPGWYQATAFVSVLPAGTLGGWLARTLKTI